MFTLQAVSLNERIKRDASDDSSSSDESDSDGSSDDNDGSSDDSDSSSDDSDGSSADNDSSSADNDSSSDDSDDGRSDDNDDACTLLRDYIEHELSGFDPELTAGFPVLVFVPSSLYVLVVNETAPTFLELLESTPSLFANLSQAIDDASGQILGTRIFNSDFFLSIYEPLAADFVAVANDSCGISLSQQQFADVTQLITSALPTFFLSSQQCDRFNQTVVERAVDEALATVGVTMLGLFTLSFELGLGDTTQSLLLPNRVAEGINNVGLLPLTSNTTASVAAQAALDEFLFTVNVFCDIPLSDVTLMQLDAYYAFVVNSLAGQA